MTHAVQAALINRANFMIYYGDNLPVRKRLKPQSPQLPNRSGVPLTMRDNRFYSRGANQYRSSSGHRTDYEITAGPAGSAISKVKGRARVLFLFMQMSFTLTSPVPEGIILATVDVVADSEGKLANRPRTPVNGKILL